MFSRAKARPVTDHQQDCSIACSVGHGAGSARDLCTNTAKLWCQSPGLSSVFCMPQPRFLMAKVNDRRLLLLSCRLLPDEKLQDSHSCDVWQLPALAQKPANHHLKSVPCANSVVPLPILRLAPSVAIDNGPARAMVIARIFCDCKSAIITQEKRKYKVLRNRQHAPPKADVAHSLKHG